MGLKVPWNQTCKLIDPIRCCQANNRKLIVEGLTFQIIPDLYINNKVKVELKCTKSMSDCSTKKPI